MLKYFLLLASVAALNFKKPTGRKPLCDNVLDVGGGGKWNPAEGPNQLDRLPQLLERGYQYSNQHCNDGKFLVYEPPKCRLPARVLEVSKRPKRVMFIGDSVSDQSAQSFSWFYQKENRAVKKKPCKFMKEDWREHLEKSGRFNETTIADTILWMEKQGANNAVNGHMWWGCKDSSVMYAPMLTLEMTNKEVIPALMYLVKTWTDEPLGADDVIVMNIGLHGLKDGFWKNLRHMDNKWTPLLTLIMKEWGEWKKEGTAPKFIWRQISPQHWSGDGGNWNNQPWAKQCIPLKPNILQFRQTDKTKYPTRNDMMFKQACQDAGLEVDDADITILPIWRASADRWDEHPNGDCTHYCMYGSVNRYWNSALLATASGMLKTSSVKKEVKMRTHTKKPNSLLEKAAASNVEKAPSTEDEVKSWLEEEAQMASV